MHEHITEEEDFSYWKYKKICIKCHKAFGSDNPNKKELCHICTPKSNNLTTNHLKGNRAHSKLKMDPEPKYDGLHLKPRGHGWQWQ